MPAPEMDHRRYRNNDEVRRVLYGESQRVQQDKTADHLLLELRTIKVLRQAIFSKLTGDVRSSSTACKEAGR